MAEYGEWNRKGATLSDVTAEAEYGVSRDFIIKGIQTGRLEYRDGAIWGNPYLRVLRGQLEAYIGEELGERYLTRARNQTELRRVKKEIGDLSKKLSTLQDRKNELEASLGQERTPNNALHRSGQAAPVSADSREPRRDAHFR